MMDRFNASYASVSGVTAISALGQMVVLLMGGQLADKYGRRDIIINSGILLVSMMGSILMVNSVWQVYAVVLVLTMVGNISSPAISAVYLEAVDEQDRATFSGITMGLSSVGLALGSLAAGIAYQVSSWWSWVGVIAMTAAQFVIYWIAIPRDVPGEGRG